MFDEVEKRQEQSRTRTEIGNPYFESVELQLKMDGKSQADRNIIGCAF
jgi:hypothetical protein